MGTDYGNCYLFMSPHDYYFAVGKKTIFCRDSLKIE